MFINKVIIRWWRTNIISKFG